MIDTLDRLRTKGMKMHKNGSTRSRNRLLKCYRERSTRPLQMSSWCENTPRPRITLLLLGELPEEQMYRKRNGLLVLFGGTRFFIGLIGERRLKVVLPLVNLKICRIRAQRRIIGLVPALLQALVPVPGGDFLVDLDLQALGLPDAKRQKQVRHLHNKHPTSIDDNRWPASHLQCLQCLRISLLQKLRLPSRLNDHLPTKDLPLSKRWGSPQAKSRIRNVSSCEISAGFFRAMIYITAYTI
jgi:hypothetical protein